MSDKEQLQQLADLLRERNQTDGKIAAFIKRPAEKSHLGEFVAAWIFGIDLHDSAVVKGTDGRFCGGSLAGKSVNIKYSSKNNGILDMQTDSGPDYYLVLTGPNEAAVSSRGKTRPWVIEAACLFHADSLVSRLTSKIGTATSVKRKFWEEAEIYPRPNSAFPLTDFQREMLALFSEASIG